MLPSVPVLSFLLALVPTLLVKSQNITLKNKIVLKREDEMLHGTRACHGTDASPVVRLINHIVAKHFSSCEPVILYDEFFYKSLTFQPVINELLRSFPRPMVHGQFSTAEEKVVLKAASLLSIQGHICRDYVILIRTLDPVAELLGYQPHSKVVLVPQASQWQINNFLESPSSELILNLLVVADSSLQVDAFHQNKVVKVDINLYTHELYQDPMGSRAAQLVSAWRCGRLTQPTASLFPQKMASLNGYQLRVVATENPPYVYQRFQRDSAGDAETRWDGLEVRLLKLISNQLNFTLKFQLPKQSSFKFIPINAVITILQSVSGENTVHSVLADLAQHHADVAVAGVHLTPLRLRHFLTSSVHSHDCAVFMTLTSTALPKYRAIMGPFRWEVWLALTLVYLLAILPISFSAHHTLRPLIDNPCELENMFWYVFGTFTNCFTFTGKQSWTTGKMYSTRMFIGIYWAFSIIISAAYTGSIIAFIMLPSFPNVMDTAQQLVDSDYRLVATNNSDLKLSLYNSTEDVIVHLSRKLKIVNSIEEAVSNVTDSPFYLDYAFLYAREFLKHVIRTNFSMATSQHKKSVFHLSKKCFVPLLIGVVFPPRSVLVQRIDASLVRAAQSGFINKLVSDVAWDQQRTGTGKLLQVSGGGGLRVQAAEERQLTLDDTQGMFLLLGAGVGLALIAFIAERCLATTKRVKGHQMAPMPSIILSDKESRNYRFRSKQDFLRLSYSSGGVNKDDHRAEAEVHTEHTPGRRVARSLTVLQPRHSIKRISV